MDIGRRHNADPRWLLPLLCRRGHITRNEIGAIRIGQYETYFQVPTVIAGKFAAAVKRTGNLGAEDESGISIEASTEAPRDAARQNRRDRSNADGPRHEGQRHDGPRGPRPGKPYAAKPYAAKPHRKGPPRGPKPAR